VLELTIITNLRNLFTKNLISYWLKIGKIGNYCQLKATGCLPLPILLAKAINIIHLSFCLLSVLNVSPIQGTDLQGI
jgi:hypothetical protein